MTSTVQANAKLGRDSVVDVERALAAIERGAVVTSQESATLDFKRQGRSRDDTAKNVAEAAACFANAHGGHVVVGVLDGGIGTAAFAGTDLDPVWLVRRIYELTTPPLTVEATPLSWAGQRLIAVRVPTGQDVHQVDNRATRRVGTSCQPISATQIAALVAERSGHDWSDEATPRGLGEVNPLAVEQARALLRSSPDPSRRAFADESSEDLLRALGLVASTGTLNNAGDLLLCDPSGSQSLIVHQFRRTPQANL